MSEGAAVARSTNLRRASPANRGHKIVKGGRHFCRYSVYLNKTDFPLVIDGTADECARVLKRSRDSFYCLVDRVRQGKNKKYTILQRMVDEEDMADGEDEEIEETYPS